MNMHERAKLETEKFINQYTAKLEAAGMQVTELHKTLLRAGVVHGLTIAGLVIISEDFSKTIMGD